MPLTRRRFLETLAAASALPAFARGAPSPLPAFGGGAFKLGLVTYNLAKDWDIATIIKNCEATGFEAVELRTTHQHGVEPALDAAARAEVRKRFADSKVRLLSLGTTCEFHSPDAAVVRKNVEECKRFLELARDLGCVGIKVRPNGIPAEVPEEKTIAQIGAALRECGEAGAGVEIWVEVHGKEVLNFQITVMIAAAVSFVLMFVFIGFLLLAVVAIGALILTIMPRSRYRTATTVTAIRLRCA